MTYTPKFSVGDLVTKGPNGKVPYEINSVPNNSYGDYSIMNKSGRLEYYSEGRIFAYGSPESGANGNRIYSYTNDDGSVSKGAYRGINSKGQYLIEEVETGTIRIMNKDDVEEVLPYTFSAKVGNSETHYVGTPGALEKGNILLHTGSASPQIAVVTAVNTKNRTPRPKFKGYRILTEEI